MFKTIQTRWSTFWNSLQSREKLIIVVGAALVFLVALWLLFNSLINQRSDLVNSRDNILGQIESFEDRADMLARLRSSCADSLILEGSAEDILYLMARRQQVVINNIQNGRSNSFVLQASANNGDAVLRYVHQLSCQGFSLGSLELKTNDSGISEGSTMSNSAGYSAILEVSRDS